MHIKAAIGDRDLMQVRRLFREYVDRLGIDLAFQGFDEEVAELPGKYAEPTGGLWLAEEDEEAVGCVALRRLREDACEMKRLYVCEAWQRRGMGRMLAETAMMAGKELGYRQMYLDTLATMVGAMRLYESLGFRRCAAYYANPIETAVYFVKEL
jgi:putative acetyltransferase